MAEYKKKNVRLGVKRLNTGKRTDDQAARRAADAAQRERLMNERLMRETDSIPMKQRRQTTGKPQKPPEKRYPQRRTVRTSGTHRFAVVEGRKRIKARNRNILLSLIALLIVTLILLSVATPVGISEFIVNGAAKMGGGSGYPIELAEDSTKVIETQDGVTTVVGSANCEAFNQNGKRIFYRQHGYLNPALSQSESRFVLYDRGSTGYSIHNMDKVLYTGELENKISAAAIGRNGTVAFATSSVEYKSQLAVMDAKCENIFNWYSADAELSAVAVSNNGKRIAAATMAATGGKYVSTLYIFNTKKDAPQTTLTLDDSMVLSIRPVGTKAILALCNNQALLLNWDGETLYTYKPVGTMQLCKVEDTHVLFAESVSGNSGGSIITLVNKKGESEGSFTVSETLRDVAYSNGAIYALGDHAVTTYTCCGNVAASTPCDFSVTNLLGLQKDGVLALGFGELAQIKAVSNSRLKEADGR